MLYKRLIEQIYFSFEGNLALYDQLTGLYNFNWMKYVGYKRFRKFEGYVTVLDLNGLKSLNDEFGHMYTNGVIMTVAKQLKDTAIDDPTAAVIRFGGDEFVIISSKDFTDVLNKEAAGAVSFGVYHKQKMDNLEYALMVADKIMYKQKQEYYKTHDRRKANDGIGKITERYRFM